jgi:hypothetical protein
LAAAVAMSFREKKIERRAGMQYERESAERERERER